MPSVREQTSKCERRWWIKRSNERSRQEEVRETAHREPRHQRLLLWAPSKEKKRCICLKEGSCRMPALLASQTAGSIPAFPAAYSFSVINRSKFCACCESASSCTGMWTRHLVCFASPRSEREANARAFQTRHESQTQRGSSVCARTLELLSKKFQLRLLTISSQPAVFSPQRKTS